MEKYEIIYNIINKKDITSNSYNIVDYCDKLIKNIPEKIISLLKKFILEILENTKSKYYSYVIDFLKILKNNIDFNTFSTYSKKLLIKYSNKSKFYRLYKDAKI